MNITKNLALVLSALVISACSDADIASRNLSTAADMFELERRIVFYDAIQGVYLLSIEGRCSVNISSSKLAVTCKTGPSSYKKHYLGLSDNVTYVSEQLEAAPVNVYNYRVIFKPEAILPDIDLQTSRTN